MNIFTRKASMTLVALSCTAGVSLTLTQPALAAPPASTESVAVFDSTFSAASTEFPQEQVEMGSLADRVGQAKTYEEAAKILEKDGFTQTPGSSPEHTVTYEKTVDGTTIGFNLTGPDVLHTLWGSGYNVFRGGPYVKGTADEWRAAATSGVIVGGGACAFITATLGAAACAAAAGLAQQWLNSNDDQLPPGQCLAVAPAATPVQVWHESC